jgi:hypothetical protein
VQHKLGAHSLLSSLGGFDGVTVGLSHHAISLSDSGEVGVCSGGCCSDAFDFDTVSIGVANGCNLSHVAHEEEWKWTAQARAHRPEEEERWRIYDELAALGLQKRIAA